MLISIIDPYRGNPPFWAIEVLYVKEKWTHEQVALSLAFSVLIADQRARQRSTVLLVGWT